MRKLRNNLKIVKQKNKELLNKHEITEKRNSELKELNRINKLKVQALLTDQSRLENEKSPLRDSVQTIKNESNELKDLNQTLKKENDAIGISNKGLDKKVEVLDKEIFDLKKVIEATENREATLLQKGLDNIDMVKDALRKEIGKELMVLRKTFEETKKALADAQADAVNRKNDNIQLKKIGRALRAQFNFAEKEKNTLKNDLRALLGELEQATIKQDHNKYRNIYLQILIT